MATRRSGGVGDHEGAADTRRRPRVLRSPWTQPRHHGLGFRVRVRVRV